MRKVFLSKWFLLAALLTFSLSVFAFAAYRKTVVLCSAGENCIRQVDQAPVQKGEMLWDALSGQFSTISVP